MKLVYERGSDFTISPPAVPRLIKYQTRVINLGRCFNATAEDVDESY
jgi:hypothetical protein